MRTRNTKDGPGIDPVKQKLLIEQYKKKQAEKERAKKDEEKKSLADLALKSQMTDANPINPAARKSPYEKKRRENGPNEEVLDRELKRHRATVARKAEEARKEEGANSKSAKPPAPQSPDQGGTKGRRMRRILMRKYGRES